MTVVKEACVYNIQDAINALKKEQTELNFALI